jgi:hypothetical protein
MKRLIIAIAALALAAPGALSAHNLPYAAASAAHQSSNYYTNSRGRRVHRPVHANRAPQGASARCRDGTYSFSQSSRGTCSHHGGVAVWL